MDNKFIQIMNKWIEEAEERKLKALDEGRYCRAIEHESYRAGLVQARILIEQIYIDQEEKNDN